MSALNAASKLRYVHALALDRDDSPHEDHFVSLHGVTWSDYRRILKIRGERTYPRIAYLEGELEIMRPSPSHRWIKSILGRLVEQWCLERDVEFSGVGAWTLEDKATGRSVEPDECYVFGPTHKVPRPHLAIEIIWTSGGIDRLEIYRKLDVAEVWIWRRGTITPHVLRGETYQPVSQSVALPGVDLQQLVGFFDQPTTSAAIRAYRELLRKGQP